MVLDSENPLGCLTAAKLSPKPDVARSFWRPARALNSTTRWPVASPLALVTFREQVRSEASDTLSYFKSQGVSVKVISGDNPSTVAAVAREAGLVFDGNGFDARNLPENLTELANLLENESVFGRVTPQQKRNMVEAMQTRSHVIAMTGDGVNDALALKKADLGIAMGDARRNQSGIKPGFARRRFSSLPGVVDEGRRVIANIERVSRLFLTKVVWAVTLSTSLRLVAL
jgi:cation-transporting ATPase E